MTLNRRTFTTALAAVIAGVAQAGDAVDDDDAIRDILKRRVDVEKRSVGMAVCVATPRQQRIVSWGSERSDDDRAVTPDTVFEIASITKIFTALLLADSARRGLVELDDPAARHLPGDFHLPKSEGREITLADLATHTSGLPRFPPFTGAPQSPSWFEARARFSLADFKSWLADLRLPRPPGAAWDYSNAGYALLGMALAHRGGRPFESLVQDRVIDPMDLRDTTFHPNAAMERRLAAGHDKELNPLKPLAPDIFAAGGALRSTPRDLARFIAAILPGSRARIAPAAQLLLTVRRPARWIGGVQALGWEVLNAPGGAFVSKDGVNRGQAASVVFDADRRIGVVVLSNTSPDLRGSAPSGGGIGAADLARHLLRPQIPMGSEREAGAAR